MSNVFSLSDHLARQRVSVAKQAQHTAYNWLYAKPLKARCVGEAAPLLRVVNDELKTAHLDRARFQMEDNGNG